MGKHYIHPQINRPQHFEQYHPTISNAGQNRISEDFSPHMSPRPINRRMRECALGRQAPLGGGSEPAQLRPCQRAGCHHQAAEELGATQSVVLYQRCQLTRPTHTSRPPELLQKEVGSADTGDKFIVRTRRSLARYQHGVMTFCRVNAKREQK